LIAETILDLFDDLVGITAIGTLIVAVLNEFVRRINGTLDVILPFYRQG
jgi:hypothetical protein